MYQMQCVIDRDDIYDCRAAVIIKIKKKHKTKNRRLRLSSREQKVLYFVDWYSSMAHCEYK